MTSWRDYLKKYPIEYLAIFILCIAFISAVALAAYKILAFPIFLVSLVSILICFATMVVRLIANKEQSTLISFAYKHLFLPNEFGIDELLGLLISDKWKQLNINVVDEFFRTMIVICKSDDYEMKRRIAEALPALYKINLEKTKDLARILRKDWDSQKWKSDNRRRTIESLSYILDKDEEFVKENLVIKGDDEIYTIIAIVEIINELRWKRNKNYYDNSFKNVLNSLPGLGRSPNEIDALRELWSLLNQIHQNTPPEIISAFQRLINEKNICLQMCVARNIKWLFDKTSLREIIYIEYPKETLNIMSTFLQSDRHRYVRRPIAKERSVDYLISLLNNSNYSDNAKEIIWMLHKDPDDIIRITSFDKVEKILEVDNSFGKDIIKFVAEHDSNQKLAVRAKNLLSRYKIE